MNMRSYLNFLFPNHCQLHPQPTHTPQLAGAQRDAILSQDKISCAVVMDDDDEEEEGEEEGPQGHYLPAAPA